MSSAGSSESSAHEPVLMPRSTDDDADADPASSGDEEESDVASYEGGKHEPVQVPRSLDGPVSIPVRACYSRCFQRTTLHTAKIPSATAGIVQYITRQCRYCAY